MRGAGSDGCCGLLVGQHLDVGQAGGVIDRDINSVPTVVLRNPFQDS